MQLGEAFENDRNGVIASVQRLRAQSQAAGTLKSTPQQKVETRTTQVRREGHRHRAGEPAGGLRAAVQPDRPSTPRPRVLDRRRAAGEQQHGRRRRRRGRRASRPASPSARPSTTTTTTGRTAGTAGHTCTTTRGTTSTTTARTRARTSTSNREDAREERDQIAARTPASRAASATSTQSQQRTERQQTRQASRPQTQAEREQRRTDAQGRADQARSSGATAGASSVRIARRVPRPGPGRARAQRDEVRRVLQLLERPVGTGRQLARPAQPQQLGRRARGDGDELRERRAGRRRRIVLSMALVPPSTPAPRRRPGATGVRHAGGGRPRPRGRGQGGRPAGPGGACSARAATGSSTSSDPATGRRNREVFLVAFAEGWSLADLGPDRKELVLGRESWPFPVPLVKSRRRAGRSTVRPARRRCWPAASAATSSPPSASAGPTLARSGSTRRGPRRHAGRDVRPQAAEHSRGARRPLLALEARRTAKSAGRHGRGGGRGGHRPLHTATGPRAVPRLLLSDSRGSGTERSGRSEGLRGRRPDVGRVRPGRVARSLRQHGRDDVPGGAGRHRVREGPRRRRPPARPSRHRALRPRCELAPGPG